MLNKEQILAQLESHQAKIKSFGIDRIGVFGSYVRNEQTAQSDIDILVSFRPLEETFDNFMELAFYLDDLFPGQRIDIATTNGLSPYIGPKILQEVMYAKVAA